MPSPVRRLCSLIPDKPAYHATVLADDVVSYLTAAPLTTERIFVDCTGECGDERSGSQLVRGLLAPGVVFAGCSLAVPCTPAAGHGGHAEALLTAADDTKVMCIDIDPHALEVAEKRLRRFGSRVDFQHTCYSNVTAVLASRGEDLLQHRATRAPRYPCVAFTASGGGIRGAVV